MEIKKIKERRGPTRNQKWGILKYLSAEFLTETLEIDQGHATCVSGTLGQKLGYDKCPYLSFFVRRFEDEIFDLMGRKDLNKKVNQFWPKTLWMRVM